MKLTRHKEVQSFLKVAKPFLERNEALTNLMLGILARIEREPGCYETVYYVTILSSKQVILVALMIVPYKLQVYSEYDDCNEAIELLVSDLLESGLIVPGVLGPKRISKKTAELWAERTGGVSELIMPMRVYELRRVNTSLIGEGSIRLATEDDLDFLVEGIVTLEQEISPNQRPDVGACYTAALNGIRRESLFVWEVGGEVVSMATKARPTQRSVSVNMVYTPERFRNKGYATSCVASLSQKLLDDGYQSCTLFTNLRNPTSNSIYQKIGYQPVGDMDDYALISK